MRSIPKFTFSALVLAALGLALIGAGCLVRNRDAAGPAPAVGPEAAVAEPGGAENPGRPPRPESPDDLALPEPPPGPPPEEVDFTIRATLQGFSPNTINVAQGKLARISFEGTDVPHTFIVDGYGIRQAVEPGLKAEISFIADKKGTFPFNCSIHPKMKGVIVVE